MAEAFIPPPTDTEAQRRFRTHSNYLRAFSWLAWGPGSFKDGLERIEARVAALQTFKKLNRLKNVDVPQVGKSLRNAWGTEALLTLTRKVAADEVLNLANSWGVVQTYYVVYHATQALSVACGSERPESHPKTQNIFNDRWVNKPLDLAPWTFGLDNTGFRNSNEQIVDIHPWQAFGPTLSWSMAAKALKTTRERLVADKELERRKTKQQGRKQAWKQNEASRLASGKKPRTMPRFPKPLLDQADKNWASERVGPVGLIDYLWRLRIGANYDDAAVFTEGPISEGDSRLVHGALCRLAIGTLLVHELFIRELIGRDALKGLIDPWLQTNVPPGLTTALALRREILIGK